MSLFNSHRAGGRGGVDAPTCGFFADTSKTMARHNCSYLSAQVVKFSDPGRSRSGLQVTPSYLTSNVWMVVIANPTDRSPWSFQRLIWVTVCIKCISRKFEIDEVRFGQFCALSIISQWEKIENLFWTNAILTRFKHRFTGKFDILNRKKYNQWPFLTPPML